MEKVNTHFAVHDRELFQVKMLNWLKRFNIFCFLNNNGFEKPGSFSFLVAAGAESELVLDRQSRPFENLQQYFDKQPAWLFGHLNYELNTGLPLRRGSTVTFPDGYFFSPQILFTLEGDELIFIKHDKDPSAIFNEIMEAAGDIDSTAVSSIRSRISRKEYLEAVGNIKEHIKRGDCYELNFCQEFYGSSAEDPASLYHRLCQYSPQPFSAFYRINENFCCCASPERFLQKTGRRLLSQPIKGTSKRGDDDLSDRENFLFLKNSTKDKSENVMVVDLVRNDLSRVCKVGSVQVPELFAVKSFPGVHQMISTVTGEMEDEIPFSKALEVTFPMGSMTGAPKIRVMQLIDQYESAARGLFSGSIGYITPDADFDFNVVIRSLFINKEKQKVSFQAGGGITHYSDPEMEYEESILKTQAIRKLLGANSE